MKQLSLLSFFIFLFLLTLNLVGRNNSEQLDEYYVESEKLDFKVRSAKIKSQLDELKDYTNKSKKIEEIEDIQEEKIRPLKEELLTLFNSDKDNLHDIEEVQTKIKEIKEELNLNSTLLEKLPPKVSWLLFLNYNITFEELADSYQERELSNIDGSIATLFEESYKEKTTQRILLYKGIIDEYEYERKLVLDRSIEDLKDQNLEADLERKIASTQALTTNLDEDKVEEVYEARLNELNYTDDELDEMNSGLEYDLIENDSY